MHLQLTSLNRPVKLVRQRVIGCCSATPCLTVNTGRGDLDLALAALAARWAR